MSLRARADDLFESYSPYEGEGLRNHCLRLHQFFCQLLDRAGLKLDHDLAYLLAMVHDLGLVTDQDPGESYLERTRNLFRRETASLDLGGVDPSVLDECLLLNHRLLPVPGASPEAEYMRRAVWIEHSRGIKRYGLDRGMVKEAFALYPRDNLDWVLTDFARRVITREPATLVRGIFF